MPLKPSLQYNHNTLVWDRASWRFVYFSAGNLITTSVLEVLSSIRSPRNTLVAVWDRNFASTFDYGVGLGTRGTRTVLVVRIG